MIRRAGQIKEEKGARYVTSYPYWAGYGVCRVGQAFCGVNIMKKQLQIIIMGVGMLSVGVWASFQTVYAASTVTVNETGD